MIKMTFKLKETHLYPLKINKIDSKAKQFITKISIYPIPSNTNNFIVITNPLKRHEDGPANLILPS